MPTGVGMSQQFRAGTQVWRVNERLSIGLVDRPQLSDSMGWSEENSLVQFTNIVCGKRSTFGRCRAPIEGSTKRCT